MIVGCPLLFGKGGTGGVDNINQWIIDAIKIIISRHIATLNLDSTFSAVVRTSNVGGTHVVTYNEEDFTTPVRAGLVLNIGDVVYVRCPGGKFADRFIDLRRP